MSHRFLVKGMSCEHCIRAVKTAVATVDSQAQVDVDLGSGRVKVDSLRAAPDLAQAITEAGYEVVDETAR